jgi:hypothetical protein
MARLPLKLIAWKFVKGAVRVEGREASTAEVLILSGGQDALEATRPFTIEPERKRISEFDPAHYSMRTAAVYSNLRNG